MDPDPAELRGFRALLTDEGQGLLRSLAAYDPATALTEGARLRRAGHPDHLVAAALTQARLRVRARPRLGALADRLYLTPAGLEQLTRPEVASRHAARFAAAADGRVLDLCCGIGGDLTALAAAGLAVTGVDRDPLAVEVARANLDVLGLGARAEVRLGDVPGDLDVAGGLAGAGGLAVAGGLAGAAGVFVDPARRSGRGRALDPRSWSPPWGTVLDLAARVPATGVKAAPGLAHDALPAGTEAEWVSVGGDVVECAVWWGPLGSGVARRATLLPAGATVTGGGTARAPAGPVGRFLHEPDGAVVRAGLVAEVADPLGATLLDPTIAYLSTPEPVASPFLTSYEVVEVLPFHLKRLRALLRQRGVGRLTVKKRGTAVTPEDLRQRLRLSGDEEATVVLTRVAGAQTVLLVEPLRR